MFIGHKSKIKVLIASVLAGGCHNTIQEMFAEQLKSSDKLQVETYRHTTELFEKTNSRNSRNIPLIYDMAYNYLPCELTTTGTSTILRECIQVLEKYKPDILICTHNILGNNFTLARYLLDVPTQVMLCMPDFGYPPYSYHPTLDNRIRPDQYIVFDEKTKAGFIKQFGLTDKDIILTGYKTKEIFDKVRDHNTDPEEVFKELRKKYESDYAPEISSAKKTVVISGGNGGFIQKSMPFLRYIARQQDKNPQLVDKYQYLVVCGSELPFYKQLLSQNKNKTTWKNIVPLGWMNHDLYAPLLKIADYHVLVSIGPSTMNEILTISNHPLLIYKSKTGQEIGNLKYAVKNNLGMYIPGNKTLLNKILSGFSDKEINIQIRQKTKYLQLQREQHSRLEANIIKAHQEYKSPAMTIKKPLKNTSNKTRLFIGIIPVIIGVALAGIRAIAKYRSKFIKAKDEIPTNR